MNIQRPEDLTRSVLAVMDATPDPRLREILAVLVEHLHSFVREVRLTESEFRLATAILNEIGQQSTPSHNEMVMMAGSLGISSLVCILNNTRPGTETHQNLLGPFWRLHAPRVENGGSIVRSETPGLPLLFTGRISDAAGRPIPGAEVDVWHSSPQGLYENQDPAQSLMNLRGRFTTDDQGAFWFWTVKPAGYPIPTHGVVGRLLRAQGRHPFRPAHIHVMAFKPGYKTLISQVYDRDDPHLDSDPQFGVTDALAGHYIRHDERNALRPEIEPPWYSLTFEFQMEPGEAALPAPPIA